VVAVFKRNVAIDRCPFRSHDTNFLRTPASQLRGWFRSRKLVFGRRGGTYASVHLPGASFNIANPLSFGLPVVLSVDLIDLVLFSPVGSGAEAANHCPDLARPKGSRQRARHEKCEVGAF
jgi:hypothetical protein